MNAKPQTAPAWRWFSSDDVPERERLAVLNDAFGSSDFPCEILPAGDESLYLAGYGIGLPGVFLTHGFNRGVEYRRGARHLDKQDSFMLTITLSGRYRVDQCHTDHVLRPGEAWAALADESASAATLPGETRESLALILPRRALEGMRVDVSTLLRPPVVCDEQALQLLVNYVRGLEAAQAPLSPSLAERAAEHVCDLAALALHARGDGADQARQRGLPAARLQRLKDDIAWRIAAGQAITLDDTASRHRISPVYVQKLFAREHTSFSAFVLAMRLEHVRRRLRNPRFAGLSISRIVYDAGFNNLSWFNRAFRRRYGVTPSDMRARH